jgi:type VI protein secretion system component VasA
MKILFTLANIRLYLIVALLFPCLLPMSINTVPSTSTIQYSIDVIQDEARQLVEKGIISRQQPIYVLCQYIPAREWVCVECELERCDFLLRDRIADLIGSEEWDND